MDIKLKQTDGGRQSSGFLRERRDCTVRSLAEAADIPYNEAHAIAKAAGRTDGHGFHTAMILTVAKQRGVIDFQHIIAKSYHYATNSYPTLLQTVAKYRTGRYIICTRHHAMAMVDGVIHDTGLVGVRSRIVQVFAVQLPQPKTKISNPVITQAQVNELWERLNRLEARA